MKRLKFLFIIFIFVLTSCIQIPNTELEVEKFTLSIANKGTNSTEILTITPQRISSSTPVFSKTPSPSRTLEPSKTFSPVPTISLTPIATLSEVESQNLTENFMRNNGGCEFPCFWGFIIPGKSNWNDSKNILDSYLIVNNSDEVPFVSSENAAIYELYGTSSQFIGWLNILNVDKKVGEIKLTQIENFYSVAEILSLNGKPQEVYLDTSIFGNAGGAIEFSLILDYSDRGYLVNYESLAGKSTGIPKYKIWWDYSPEELANVYIWPPDEGKTVKDLFPYFLPISKYTDMDLDSFYEHFQEGNVTLRIEIFPEELEWLEFESMRN